MAEPHGTPPRVLARLVTQAALAKTHLSYPDYIIKSFLGGVFISLGALTDLVILSGSPGLRESNPSLAAMIAGFTFPTGFVLIILTNVELCTSNMFVMPFTILQRKTTVWDLVKNWVISYLGNLAGCLFVAGFLAWWTNTLSTPAQQAYAVTQAEGRVNVGWSVNFLRGIGCNIFVALAMFLSLGSADYHSIANFFQVPVGMFYGTNFGVGRYIYQSVIPVTLGNIVGAGLFGIGLWWLYGREEEVMQEAEKRIKDVERDGGGSGSGSSSGNGSVPPGRLGIT
ncbi:hypothetical protein LTR56_003645 [Elasticomyces elasticus]|nr:hypothetical protein LTR56_003645 [Elasticomyces elasticus]KAK3663778.1 hypothetical protein LTR22_005479 [Elasticomyces elasticus]KAK4927297.1 hypothetical protein LTR49_005962 [Elasticomyces elasticus]KAK5767297.1 hypothetical protein LTS12_002450 [Elasticomyces elasticus]